MLSYRLGAGSVEWNGTPSKEVPPFLTLESCDSCVPFGLERNSHHLFRFSNELVTSRKKGVTGGDTCWIQGYG